MPIRRLPYGIAGGYRRASKRTVWTRRRANARRRGVPERRASARVRVLREQVAKNLDSADRTLCEGARGTRGELPIRCARERGWWRDELGCERVETRVARRGFESSRFERNEPRPDPADSRGFEGGTDPKRSATSHRREHDRVTSQTGHLSEAPPRRVRDARRVFVDGRTTRDQGLRRPSQRVTCFISTHEWPQRTARCDLGPLSRRGVRPPNGPISNERSRSLRAGRATPRKNDAGIVPP